jgi:hypothetical protein
MAHDMHELILLLGRPASGKSETLDYLRRLDAEERLRRFKVGRLLTVDDFPLLWEWFEEDAILERMGKPRLHSTPDGYFSERYLWDVLIQRLCLEYDKLCAREADLRQTSTVIMEFSRGTEHGGYAAALDQLSETVLSRAGAVYVSVSFEESLRKNRRRCNAERPDSILEHSLPDEKLERLYKLDDWKDLKRSDPGHLMVRGHRVPCVDFDNHDDVTTPRGEALGARLEQTMRRLRELQQG